jgi:DNA modification methylase
VNLICSSLLILVVVSKLKKVIFILGVSILLYWGKIILIFSMAELTANRIRSTFLRLDPNLNWSFRNVERGEMNALTHGYHRYPAKFIPQIVQQLINDHAPNGNEVICDPFGGCGTTLVEAKVSGRKSIGFDINPIAKLITEVKITPIKPSILEKYRDDFIQNYEGLKQLKKKIANRHPRLDYWFDELTIEKLDKIYTSIKFIKNPKVKKFFLCAFSHNLKNCSRWLMKSIKPTIDKKKTITDPKASFLRHLNSMIKKNKSFHEKLIFSNRLGVPAIMQRRNSTRKLPLNDNSIDLIITSPPYVTSYEYADLHQLSLLWFGNDSKDFKNWNKFVENFNDFRSQFVGTSFKKQNQGYLDSSIAEKIVSDLRLVDKSLATDVENYFVDMKKVFFEMGRILKIGGKACIIVGNTSLRGVEILNAEVAVEQMSRLGFKKVNFIKREVSNKMITPWRDKNTGKFTGLNNPSKMRVYEFEYVIVMEK